MGNSRKIVDRLQRMTRTETKPPVEQPKAPAESPEGGRSPRHVALREEELTTLRKIVLNEQLAPFKPEAPPPPEPQSLAPVEPESPDQTLLRAGVRRATVQNGTVAR